MWYEIVGSRCLRNFYSNKGFLIKETIFWLNRSAFWSVFWWMWHNYLGSGVKMHYSFIMLFSFSWVQMTSFLINSIKINDVSKRRRLDPGVSTIVYGATKLSLMICPGCIILQGITKYDFFFIRSGLFSASLQYASAWKLVLSVQLWTLKATMKEPGKLSFESKHLMKLKGTGWPGSNFAGPRC